MELFLGHFALLLLAFAHICAGSLHEQVVQAFRLAAAAHQSGDYEEAQKRYEQVLAISDVPQVRNNLASIYQLNGKFEDARDQYSLAIKGRPDYAEAHLNLCILVAEEFRELEAALESCETAVKLKEGYVKAHQMTGNILQVPLHSIAVFRRELQSPFPSLSRMC